MPAAIAIPLIIGAASAGAQVASAKMSSNAAKKAAGLQVASADKALALENDQFHATQQRMQPYVDSGQKALSTLNGLVYGGAPSGGGMPQGGGGLLAPYARTFNPSQPGGGSLGPMPNGVPSPQAMQGQPPAMQGAPSAMQGPSQVNGDLVTMRAPDGSTKQVPRGQQQYWMQKGAQVVN